MITVYHLNFDNFKQDVLFTGVDVREDNYFQVAEVDTNYVGSRYIKGRNSQ